MQGGQGRRAGKPHSSGVTKSATRSPRARYRVDPHLLSEVSSIHKFTTPLESAVVVANISGRECSGRGALLPGWKSPPVMTGFPTYPRCWSSARYWVPPALVTGPGTCLGTLWGLAGVDVEAVGMAFSGGVGDSLGVCEGYVVNVLVGATVPVGTVFSATSNTLALSLSHPVEVAAAVNANLMAEVTSRVLFTMAASES